MISRIEIARFQGWPFLCLDLERITTLIGPSDTGKSSVLRALRWVLLNKKPGKGTLGYLGSKTVTVKIVIDGTRVVRRQSKTQNLYHISGHDTWEVVKTSVPEEIKNLFRVGDVNFQDQRDPPFLLNLSPGKVSRSLNELIDIDLLDRVQSRSTSELRAAKTKSQVTTEQFRESRKTVRDLSWVMVADRDLRKIEDLEKTIQETSEDLSDLEDIVSTLREYEERRSTLRSQIRDCERIEEMAATLEYQEKKKRDLENLVDRIKRLREKRSAAENKVEKARQLQAICPECGRPL